jgi:hypothetical protein
LRSTGRRLASAATPEAASATRVTSVESLDSNRPATALGFRIFKYSIYHIFRDFEIFFAIWYTTGDRILGFQISRF